jgi:hypothetical protein
MPSRIREALELAPDDFMPIAGHSGDRAISSFNFKGL